ncbi:hypothetical protein FSP39_009634 [Pinctada imbricata]|uniref:Uncharacterized protein n=1 Tax=Pinctada imbricata TaxID=66713 RepID=A0AA89CAB5_PINIB|nr:hypothetical protein FSP39_009634 [Pinctada imbricata]
MALGSVAISYIGSNLQGSITNHSVTYHKAMDDAGTGFQAFTRGVYNFSDVVNTGGVSTATEHEIKIEFEAFVLTVDNINDGDTHWVSAGVEYNNSYNVWIGQTSYVIKTGTQASSKIATFEMTPNADTDMEVGTSMTLTLNVLMPYPSPDIAVETISLHDDTSNTDLRVVSLVVSQTGKSLETGDASQDDLLRFEALVYLKSTAPIGEVYPIGMGIEVDTSEVYVSYFNITSTSASGGSLQQSIILDAPNHNSSAYLGGVIEIDANISTPESGTTEFMVEIETKATSPVADPGFLLVEVTEKEKGQNVLCSEHNVTYEKSDPATTGTNDIINKAVVNVKVTNFGMYTAQYGNEANNYTLSIRVLPLAGLAAMNSQHEVEVKVGGTSEKLTYTVDGQAPYDQSVNYNFTFYHNCTRNSLTRNSVFEFFLDIDTERNTNPGPITVEFPVPTNYSESYFSVCSYEVISIGSNVVCALKQAITDNTVTTLLPDGDFQKVKLVIPGSCNLGLTTDSGADTIRIKMLAKIRNDSAVDTSTEEWFGIGATYSPTQVWVAQYKIIIRAPDYYPGLAIINGIVVDNADIGSNSFPGIFGIEWSLDGTTFNDKAVNWISSPGNATHTAYDVQTPFIVSYISMKHTETCNMSCYIDHQYVVTDLANYIEIFNDDGTLLQDFSYALDKNNATCFDLPAQGNRPPLFWVRLNVTILEVQFQKFEILVSGKGLSCNKHGGNRVLQVSYPTSSSVGKFHGDIQFCELVYDGAADSPNALCKYQCPCADSAQCEEAFIFMANSETSPPTTTWQLCEISAQNY